MTMADLLIGVRGFGVLRHDGEPPLDVDTTFRLAKEAGVFDYYDRMPLPALVEDHIRAAAKYDLPILAGGGCYTLGRDEALLEANLRLGHRLGSRTHMVAILARHADGRVPIDMEIADAYLRAHDLGAKLGVLPSFDIQVDLWSEEFPRVEAVAALVKARGVPFRIALDAGHVILKIGNAEEQRRSGIEDAVRTGTIALDPFRPDNICARWIKAGLVNLAHARSAVPGGPGNVWAKDEDGRPGRALQYPFIEPKPGEWHSPWQADRLEPFKEMMRQLLWHHASDPASPLRMISLDFNPGRDFGAGARYSIVAQNIALARWLRETWTEMRRLAAAGLVYKPPSQM